MWTSGSRNHTPKNHSPLPSKPYVVVTAALGLGRPDAEDPAAATQNVDWEPCQPPLLNCAPGADCARPTGQRFAFDAALIGPHPPGAAPVLGNEVDVRALGRERRIESQRAAALL